MASLDRFLIGDCGRIYSAQSSQLLRRLGRAVVDGRVITFAVRNLGFVAFSIDSRGSRIWLSPRTAAPKAVIAIRDELRRERPVRVLLTLLADDGETIRIYPDWQEAAIAIALAVSEGTLRRRDAYLSQERSTGAIEKFPVLMELYKQWSAEPPARFLTSVASSLEANAGLRIVLADCNLANGTSLIARMGGAFTAFEDRWLRIASGLRVQDQADYSYGLWIASTYASVAASGAVRIDDVDIEVKRPHVGLIRSRYRRLLLPIAASRPDHVTILSANILDRTIDLRLSQAQ
ncbi:hypothetical protein [Pseudorhodoplanes sp.]|uniref:hypothetical protein n=1 Tax=Pseudorhodoplanes sp. TaxID=1934341 RepID=UPI003D0D76C6